MLQITLDENNNAVIRAEFWELDHIYFRLLQFAGQHGMYRDHPFPGYENATKILLALTYEIRHAENGDRELYTYYNGISDDKIAPAGTHRSQIVKEEDKHVPEELIKNIEDDIMFNSDIDLDDFYEMDEDKQADVLDDLDIDPDDAETYLNYLNIPTYPYAQDDYPDATLHNTALQFRLPLAEAILYAMIINELMKQKDEYIHFAENLADETNTGLSEYWRDDIDSRLRFELLTLEQLSEQVFSCIYRILGHEKYAEFRKKIEAPLSERSLFKDLTDDDIARLEEITTHTVIALPKDMLAFLNQIN